MAATVTPTQQLLMDIIPRITGSLSILGSSYIVGDVIRKKRQRGSRSSTTRDAYHKNQQHRDGGLRVIDRFLIGMSLCDIVASIATPLVLNLALPAQLPFGDGKGNQATCNAQGFLSQFVTATCLYSACLAVTYMLSIKYSWRERQLQVFERISHATILSFVVLSGSVSIHLELYNPTPLSCTMISFPPGCSSNNGPNCIRGEAASIWRLPFRTIPEYTAIGVATISMILIYLSVRKVEDQVQKWTFHHHHQSQGSGDSANHFGLSETATAPTTTTTTAVNTPTGNGGSYRSATTTATASTRASASASTRQESSGSIPPAPDGYPLESDAYVKGKEEKEEGEEARPECTSTLQTRLPPLDPSQLQQQQQHQNKQQQQQDRRLSRDVGIQGICYVGAFLLTWTVPTIARCLMRFGGNKRLGVEWLIAINFFLPLQGFFNFLVYVRPTSNTATRSKSRSRGGSNIISSNNNKSSGGTKQQQRAESSKKSNSKSDYSA